MDDELNLREIIERAKNYDTEAFGRLYDLYFDKIFRFAYCKIGSRHEAEDIAEQTFLRALEKIAEFEWRGIPFSSWLFRITSNLIVDYYRSNKYETVDIAEEAIVNHDDGCSPEQSAMQELERREIVKAIRSLTWEQQQVIAMRFFAGMTNEEVAKAIGKNVGAVKALQHRAVESLGRILGASYSEARYR
ncbi:MAG: sigma-70 family RNA polymerase sigma factor [Actinomycetota bacterium]|nr:sigma-70 family RNA polymerase sigma factor [Actinomycetota bacterium]